MECNDASTGGGEKHKKARVRTDRRGTVGGGPGYGQKTTEEECRKKR